MSSTARGARRCISANVTGPVGGNYQFGFTAPAAHPDAMTRSSAIGVHPDVHVAAVRARGRRHGDLGRLRRRDASDRTQGRRRQSRRQAQRSHRRMTGIATLQSGYVATHPLVDGYLARGHSGQRHARARRRHAVAGALPRRRRRRRRSTPARRSGSSTSTPRRTGTTTAMAAFTRPVRRSNRRRDARHRGRAAGGERRQFLHRLRRDSGAGRASRARHPVAFGTIRVWMSEDWGTTWHTLPSLTDPMAVAAQSSNTDACVLAAARPASAASCSRADGHHASRLFVLCRRAVLKFDLVADAARAGGLRVDADGTHAAGHAQE